MSLIDKPGIYAISAESYHEDPLPQPSLSASIASVLLNQSPLHAYYRHPRLSTQPIVEEATHFDLGTAVHSMFLEGANVASICDVLDKDGEPVADWRTKAAREFRDNARLNGQIPLLTKHVPQIKSMVDAIRTKLNDHEAGNAFDGGLFESTLVWQEPNGIWCRARPDFIKGDHSTIDDLKTGYSAHPNTLSRIAFANGWHIQDAFYRRGLRMIDPKCDPTFRFVVVETEPPHALSVVALDPHAQALSDRLVIHAIKLWGKCLTENKWPGYSDRIAYLEMPAWEEQRMYSL